MGSLVDQLRDRAYSSKVPDRLCEEAADEIERLRRAVAELEQVVTKPMLKEKRA